MSHRRFTKIILILLALPLLFSACRKEEEPTPTAVPTLQATAVAPTDSGPEPEPTATTAVQQQPPTPIDYNWPPQIIYSSPEPGEEVMLDGAITIRFDQPMDKDAVENAFSIGRTGETGQVSGSFSWPRSDTLIFTPASTLDRHQKYDVQIADSAAAENGLPLKSMATFQVETVGFLEVSQVIPETGGTEVGTDAAITIMFNRPVVPLVSSGQQANLPSPITIQPPVEGQGDWVSTSIYRFTPDEPLDGATEYTVTAEAGLEDVTGGELAETFTWRFTTLRPEVVTIEPFLEVDRPLLPTRPFTVTFNMPMDQASAEGAISFSPSANVEFDWSEDGRVVVIQPTPRLELDTDYQLLVENTARSANGEATMDGSTSYSFRTVPFPTVIETMPANGTTAERWQRGFTIRFASPMDFDTLEGQIVVEPDPGDFNTFYDEYNFYLYSDFEMDRNTTYQITIPGSAADVYGNTLGEDFVFSYRTPDYDPLVSMNLTNQISQLSRSYPSDIDIVYRNVSRIDAELYQIPLPIEILNSPYLPDYTPPGTPIRTWTINVEQKPEVAEVFTLSLADGAPLPTGIYFLRTSAPEITESFYWQLQDVILIVSDTNIVVKETFDNIYVWATDLATGQPAEGRSLTFYNGANRVSQTATTDSNGLASIENLAGENYLQGVLAVSNEPGQEGYGIGSSVWSQEIMPWEFGLAVEWNAEQERYAYLYTDRPIYRPGDTVYFRGIVRDTNYGRYPLPTSQEVSLNLLYSTNYEQMNYDFTATLDANGEFSGEYTIPEDAQLGNYVFYFDTGDIQAERSFSVAQYRRPEFQVTATPETDEALRGDTVEVVVEASYFFGGPAPDLEVSWSISEQSYRFPWEGPYYSFGDDANYIYESSGPFNFGGGEGTFGRWLTSGTGRTNGNGQLVIEVPADLFDDIDPGSRRITVEANVQDVSQFAIATRASIIFHEAETYVGVVAEDYVAAANVPADVNLITVDWDQEPVSNTDVEVTVYQREWEPIRDVESSEYYTRWEAIDTEVEQFTVTTDEQGKATATFTPTDGGSYIVVATVTDDNGRTQLSSTSLWAIDDNFSGWPTDPREKRMDLVADAQDYQVGDTAHILVQSPFAGATRAWLTIERGDVIEQSVITLNGTSDIVDIPITNDFAPNVFVTIHAVKGIDGTNPYADIRIGMTELIVAPDHLALNVTLTPQDDTLEPRDTAVYDIQVTDSQGNPVQADLSLALVDLAVLSLKEDNAPPIVEAFYRRQPIRSQTGTGLIYSAEGLTVEIPLEAGGRGGGGGGEAEAARSFALDDDETRRNFPDTAFWEASITTDEDGTATIEIPLPDTATTWRLSSKAVSTFETTGETLVGQSSVDVVASLPVLVRPVTPRFFTVGDSLLLGAIVHNNTDEAIEMEVSLDADGIVLEGEAEFSATIPANSSQLFQWPVVVEDVEFANLTFVAQGDGYRDATKPGFGVGPEQLIPVTRYTGADIVGTSGVLEGAGREVEAVLLPPNADERQGELTIQVSASLAGALTEALTYVNEDEYKPACAHVITNQLLPNIATATALIELDIDSDGLADELDRLIERDLIQLANLQRSSGGWGWCYARLSDPYLSAYSLLALVKAQEAGYTVEERTVERAVEYVQEQIEPAGSLQSREEVNRQAFFLYVLAEAGTADPAQAEDLFSEHRALMDPYAKAFLALALDLSNGSAGNQSALLDDLGEEVNISAGGAHWEDEVPDWNNLSSDIRGTAIILNALARLDADNGMAPNTVRWLMSARTAGHWATGHEDAWSIMALTDWIVASGELRAEYTYQIHINGSELADDDFNQSNITETTEMTVAVNDLRPDEVNFVDFQRSEGNGRLYYTAYLNTFISAEDLPAANHGAIVQRAYYASDCDPEESECERLTSIEAGEMVRVELTVIVPNDLVYAIVEDHFPAGAEAIDPGLETSASGTGGSVQNVSEESYRYGYWGWWYFNNIEYRDDRVVFTSDFLPAGTYQYSYTLQTSIPGEYQVLPAIAYQEFFPDVFGRSEGFIFTIEE